MRITPLLAVLFAALGGVLPAQVLNIDFNTSGEPYSFAGLAAVPDAAGESAVWNQITGGPSVSAGALVDSSGIVSTSGIEWAGIGAIADPTSGKTSEIYLYCQGNEFMGTPAVAKNGLFTIRGEARRGFRDVLSGSDGALAERVEYVKYTVAADAGGRIDFTWTNVVAGPTGNVIVDLDGSNPRCAVIDGIQIVDVAAAVVPEPATALLGCLGLLTLMVRRRV